MSLSGIRFQGAPLPSLQAHVPFLIASKPQFTGYDSPPKLNGLDLYGPNGARVFNNIETLNSVGGRFNRLA